MKRIISLLAAFAVVLVMSVPAFAAPEVAGTAGEYENSDPAGVDGGSVIEFTQANYVVDNADAFTDSEEAALFEKITAIRTKYKFDVVILTSKQRCSCRQAVHPPFRGISFRRRNNRPPTKAA